MAFLSLDKGNNEGSHIFEGKKMQNMENKFQFCKILILQIHWA